MDVLVIGAGPAGTALAGACARQGLRTGLLDPAPDRPWRATYAAWHEELPPELPADAIAVTAHRTRAVAVGPHALPPYAVLDNERLRAHLRHPGITVHTGRATRVVHSATDSTVHISSGHHLVAAVVVDATGAGRSLTGGPPRGDVAEQTAVGVTVPREWAAPLLDDADALFMDWRPAPNQSGGAPTFLYALPMPGDRVLVEETSLARRPGLPLSVLRRRLRARFAAMGRDLDQLDGPEERVRFPLDLPAPGPSRVVAFGAASALVHPATGYSLATALTLAPRVARAVAEALPSGPSAAAAAARRVVWPPAALAVHLLRRRGLEVVLGLPPSGLPPFFEAFFRLRPDHRRAYLSHREDLQGTVAAMAGLFGSASWRLRAHLALGVLGLRLPDLPGVRP
ncbi:lycopene cyclase family protein [Streptoalloteichus hindustanus]|uniref:Lycopene cyclase (CrtL-type) n=1 Tax=Streptoalloteichus hindustanus TaxID=2017 RepID=A0A1M4YEM0_STRHI|nr:lycopene cyclase family protein [Streptoalloteichus hindustanus]SHF04043.1 lycopene cyclase (CrtL-type) [Streptoalloteichus hindustanus]